MGKERDTKEICGSMTNNGYVCGGTPSWKVQGEEVLRFVCDKCLANSLREAGLPALVEEHKAKISLN